MFLLEDHLPRNSEVDKSTYRAEIIEMLGAGWSAVRVRTSLLARHGGKPEVPSVHSIRRYRSAHVPVEVIPVVVVNQPLNLPRHHVDVLEVLDSMLYIQEERIARMWRQELETGKEQHGLNSAINVARAFLRDRYRIEGELGGQGRGRAGAA